MHTLYLPCFGGWHQRPDQEATTQHRDGPRVLPASEHSIRTGHTLLCWKVIINSVRGCTRCTLFCWLTSSPRSSRRTVVPCWPLVAAHISTVRSSLNTVIRTTSQHVMICYDMFWTVITNIIHKTDQGTHKSTWTRFCVAKRPKGLLLIRIRQGWSDLCAKKSERHMIVHVHESDLGEKICSIHNARFLRSKVRGLGCG